MAAVIGAPCPDGSKGFQVVLLQGVVLLVAVVLAIIDVGGFSPLNGVVTFVLHVYATLITGSS